MIDVINAVLSNSGAFRWVLFLGVIWAFYRYMDSGSNPLYWWHFFASKGADGQYYADLNKLGQVTGIAVGSFAIVQLSAGANKDFIGFAAVLAAYFTFVGGVSGYAAFLRSKSGRTETTTTTEPAPVAPVRTTTVTTEPAAEVQPTKGDSP